MTQPTSSLPPVAAAPLTQSRDQIIFYPGLYKGVAHCRMRLFTGDEGTDTVPIVIVTELLEFYARGRCEPNVGLSVTNGAERIAGVVHDAFLQKTPRFWLIEHYPNDGTEAECRQHSFMREHFALVSFNERGWQEISTFPPQAPGRRHTGYGTDWSHLTKEQVESFIGQSLID